MKIEELRDEIYKIVGSNLIDVSGWMDLTIEIREFNVETLFKLSDFLGTPRISVSAEGEYSSGGCDTCDWGETKDTWVVLFIRKADLKPEIRTALK